MIVKLLTKIYCLLEKAVDAEQDCAQLVADFKLADTTVLTAGTRLREVSVYDEEDGTLISTSYYAPGSTDPMDPQPTAAQVEACQAPKCHPLDPACFDTAAGATVLTPVIDLDGQTVLYYLDEHGTVVQLADVTGPLDGDDCINCTPVV